MTEPALSLDELLAACGEPPEVRAATVAYALVTAYDHDVAELEIGRYLQLVHGDDASAGPAFAALAKAMQADLDAATRWATRSLAQFRHDDTLVQAAAEAARVAAVADAELAPREEVAMKIVADALGLIAASI